MTKTVILGGLVLGIALMLALAGVTPALSAGQPPGNTNTACAEITQLVVAGVISPELGAQLLARLGCPPDFDFDGVPDSIDNCPRVFNPDQADDDGNGIGNVCDPGQR